MVEDAIFWLYYVCHSWAKGNFPTCLTVFGSIPPFRQRSAHVKWEGGTKCLNSASGSVFKHVHSLHIPLNNLLVHHYLQFTGTCDISLTANGMRHLFLQYRDWLSTLQLRYRTPCVLLWCIQCTTMLWWWVYLPMKPMWRVIKVFCSSCEEAEEIPIKSFAP